MKRQAGVIRDPSVVGVHVVFAVNRGWRGNCGESVYGRQIEGSHDLGCPKSPPFATLAGRLANHKVVVKPGTHP